MSDNEDLELKALLECAFKGEYFHYVINGIKLPCDGYACKDCVKIDVNINCHYCSEQHKFSQNELDKLKIDKLCRTSLNANRQSFYEEIKKRSNKFNGTEIQTQIKTHFDFLKQEINEKIEVEILNLQMIKQKFFEIIDENRENLNLDFNNSHFKTYCDQLNQNETTNITLDAFFDVQSKFVNAQKDFKNLLIKLNSIKFKRSEKRVDNSFVGEIIHSEDLAVMINDLQPLKRKLEPTSIDDDFQQKCSKYDENIQLQQREDLNGIINGCAKNTNTTLDDIEMDLNYEKSFFEKTDFQLKEHYNKKLTKIYHEIKTTSTTKPKDTLNLNRIYKLNNEETEYLLIDLYSNLFYTYKFHTNELNRIEIDEKLNKINSYITTCYSQKSSKLYIIDIDSNFHEFKYINQSLQFNRKLKLRNCEIIECLELDEESENEVFYACDIKAGCIQIFSVTDDNRILNLNQYRSNEIANPKYLKIKQDYLFVICTHDDKLTKNLISNLIILNKFNFLIKEKIEFNNWFNPYGLFINTRMDCLITTTSKRDIYSKDKIFNITECEYLMIFDIKNIFSNKNEEGDRDLLLWKIVAELNLDFSLINDFYVMKNNKILFLLDHSDKPIVVVELD